MQCLKAGWIPAKQYFKEKGITKINTINKIVLMTEVKEKIGNTWVLLVESADAVVNKYE